MRRVYYLNPKRKQIVQEAILQMRATQKALGPEFMTRLKMLIKDFDPDMIVAQITATAGVPVSVSPSIVPEEAAPPQPASEPVDHKKNLLIIMKFLELKQGNKPLQGQVRTLLSEAKILN